MRTDFTTLKEAVCRSAERLADAVRQGRLNGDLVLPRQEARWLVEHVTGLGHSRLISDPAHELTDEQIQHLTDLINRRLEGEPLAYLIGTVMFRDMELRVAPGVLIPRPETEELVSHAHELCHAQGGRLLDLGTGSGALALALAKEWPNAEVWAVDQSASALEQAAANGAQQSLPVTWVKGDWWKEWRGWPGGGALAAPQFDLVLSNPPYIRGDDPHLERDGLPYEPRIALTDEADGLACLRAIVEGAGRHMKDGAWIILEHGFDQGKDVRALLLSHGFEEVHTRRDMVGQERCTLGVRR